MARERKRGREEERKRERRSGCGRGRGRRELTQPCWPSGRRVQVPARPGAPGHSLPEVRVVRPARGRTSSLVALAGPGEERRGMGRWDGREHGRRIGYEPSCMCEREREREVDCVVAVIGMC